MFGYLVHGGTAAARNAYVARQFLTGAAPEDVISVFPENRIVGIGTIRNLLPRFSFKRSAVLSVIIHNAEQLTIPAQGSLLKLLEEPPRNTQFILTTPNHMMLLSTIRSRLVSVYMGKGEEETDRAYLQRLKRLLPRKRHQIVDAWQTNLDEILPALLRELRRDLLTNTAPSSVRSTATAIRRVLSALEDHRHHVNRHLIAHMLVLDLQKILV